MASEEPLIIISMMMVSMINSNSFSSPRRSVIHDLEATRAQSIVKQRGSWIGVEEVINSNPLVRLNQ